MKHKGVICGILAAVCYGTNPFGALPLYEEGVNTSSVLFYRFTMAVVILGVMLLVQRKSFSINSKELKVLLLLGVLFSASCITYYESFQVIDAGIASTILFVYPIIVALLMSLFFKERLKVSTMSCLPWEVSACYTSRQEERRSTRWAFCWWYCRLCAMPSILSLSISRASACHR